MIPLHTRVRIVTPTREIETLWERLLDAAATDADWSKLRRIEAALTERGRYEQAGVVMEAVQ
jgi:hypothetical protein